MSFATHRDKIRKRKPWNAFEVDYQQSHRSGSKVHAPHLKDSEPANSKIMSDSFLSIPSNSQFNDTEVQTEVGTKIRTPPEIQTEDVESQSPGSVTVFRDPCYEEADQSILSSASEAKIFRSLPPSKQALPKIEMEAEVADPECPNFELKQKVKDLAKAKISEEGEQSSGSRAVACQSLRSMMSKRNSYVINWVGFFFLGTLACLGQMVIFWPCWSPETRILMMVIAATDVVIGVILFGYHLCDQEHWLLYSTYAALFSLFTMQSMVQVEPKQMLSEQAQGEYVDHLAYILHSFSPVLTVVIIQAFFVALELIDTRKIRKKFFIFFTALFFMQVVTQAHPIIKCFKSGRKVGIASGCVIIVLCIMMSWLYKLKNIQSKIFLLEQDEANRYKYMFNSIKDLIVVESNGKVIFSNQQASEAFAKLDKETSRECSSDNSNILQQESFFMYQNYFDIESSCERSREKVEGQPFSKDSCSLLDLLQSDFKNVNSCIFTTSKEISQSRSLDSLQSVLDSRGGEKQDMPLFVSIQLIKVKKEVFEDIYEDGDEVMIQIQDVSHRILGQNLKIERQYMAIMNSTVSHEMRNPLNALLSSVEIQQKRVNELAAFLEGRGLADECSETTASFAKSLSVSRSSCKLLKFNVEDILALPQIQQGKFTKNVSHSNLERSVNEILQIMEFQVREKRIEVQVEFTGFGDNLDIFMDEQRFQQILLNFFSNSIKFTKKGGQILILLHLVTDRPEGEKEFIDARLRFFGCQCGPLGPKIDAEFAQLLKPGDSNRLILSVLDNGVGIRDEDQQKLFKMFGCLQSTRKVNTKGVGLGLAICKMIAEEFEGRVAVQSKFGIGSAFYCSLAVNKVFGAKTAKHTSGQVELSHKLNRVKAAQIRESAANLRAISISGQDLAWGKRILVVDDEAYNCEVLGVMIRAMGVQPSRLDLCMSGEEAIEKVQEASSEGLCQYGVILTDLSMPFIDGYQCSKEIRRHLTEKGICRSQQPLIAAITGHTECEFYTSAFEAGIDQVYSKPLSSEHISLILTQAGFKVNLSEEVRKRLLS